MIRHCNRIFEPHFEMVERVRSYHKTEKSLQIASTGDLIFNKYGKTCKGSASQKGSNSIKRMLFSGSNNCKNSKEVKTAHKVDITEDLNANRDQNRSRSKRSCSLGSVFRNKVSSRVEGAARSIKKAGQNCATQQLYVSILCDSVCDANDGKVC